MFVCECCLKAIECHEGPQMHKRIGYFDRPEHLIVEEDDEEVMLCEWCKEYMPVNEMYEVM